MIQLSLFEEENKIKEKKIDYIDKLLNMSGTFRSYIEGDTDEIRWTSCGYSIENGMVMLHNKKAAVIKGDKTIIKIKRYEIVKRLKQLRKEHEWESLKTKLKEG